ncbi:probable methyltransferase-like protein 15 [Clonorchis sinensis]|uniref:Probable methyltransferase-like protein 15 n=1 Tax=Clonorchis sinensis TaxID=79923 RepID=G7YFN4_CLOSI|nr:probable methyltransferase-like protein 15 [Clonorchis sinensis]
MFSWILSEVRSAVVFFPRTLMFPGKRFNHIPVMEREIVDFLSPKPNEVLLDMTFGAGGHTRALLETTPNLKCYCLDRDREFLSHFEQLKNTLGSTTQTFVPLLGKFSDLPQLCQQHDLRAGTVDMIVMDLGVSSMQLDNPERGFAFKTDCSLDMRMDGLASTPTAADVLNNLNAADLAQIFRLYGEERYSRRIANAITDHRHTLGPIRTTKQLADIICSVVPSRSTNVQHGSSTHPATRVFQALRIFVNDELNELCAGLELAEKLLKPATLCPGGRAGRLAVISFHSLEDRIVKWAFSVSTTNTDVGLAVALANRTTASMTGIHRRQALLRQLDPSASESLSVRSPRWAYTTDLRMPTEEEISRNQRARSAKLRGAVKA